MANTIPRNRRTECSATLHHSYIISIHLLREKKEVNTLSGWRTHPLQAEAMNWRVSMSGSRPRGVVGSGGPPTWTTQQLMLAPRMLLTVEWKVVGSKKPEIPSVRRMRPVYVCVHVCVCVGV